MFVEAVYKSLQRKNEGRAQLEDDGRDRDCRVPARRSARAGAAQRGGPAGGERAAAAPVDLTGYWVTVVTEDWRYRMVTPPKGDIRACRSTPKATRSPTPGIRPRTKRRASSARRTAPRA